MTQANGQTVIADAEELRAKKRDRIQVVAPERHRATSSCQRKTVWSSPDHPFNVADLETFGDH